MARRVRHNWCVGLLGGIQSTQCPSDIGVLDAEDAEDFVSDRLSSLVPLDSGEIVVLVVRPHVLLLAANMLPTAIGLLLVLGILFVLRLTTGQGVTSVAMLVFGFALVGSSVLSVLEYRARLYVLTDRRVFRRSGWSRVKHEACALGDIKSVDVIPEPPQGVSMSVGNIAIRSGQGVLPWQYVPDPLRVREVLLETVQRYGGQNQEGDGQS